MVVKRILVLWILYVLPTIGNAIDIVPYSVKSIKAIGSGFVELVGPGKIQINNEIFDYDGTTYIATKNIDRMNVVPGATKACVLSHSSEGYTENISVLDQSCEEIIKVIDAANRTRAND